MNDTVSKGLVRGCAVFVSFCLFFAAGCAGKPPVAPSVLQMEANRYNRRGIKSEARGESLQALEAFSEALRINSSIENSEGIVAALINSSRVHRHNGDAKAALAMITRAIPLVARQAPLYAEVAFEMAQVKLLSGESGAAAEWAATAVNAETGAKHGMRINLLARILFLGGNLPEAESKTRQALLLNREEGRRDEEANSLRMLGDIMASGERRGEAAEFYYQALAIDKELGKSRKVAADLRALARMALAQEDQGAALAFYQRSFAVSSAGGDRSGAADDLLQMALISEQRGEKEQADRMRGERDKLLKKTTAP